MNDCIFCKIIKREIPATIKLENDSVIAFVSNEPAAEVHILVAPKKHISSFAEIAAEDKDLFFEMVKVAQELVQKENIGEGYKLVFNGGKYQSVPHLHWHLLGGKFEGEWKEKI